MGPGTFEIGGPAAFEGFGTATAQGIGRGLAATGGFLNEVSRYTPMYRMQESLSDLLGVGETFRAQEQMVDDAISGAINYYRVDPQTTGFVGQVSYGAFSTVLPAVIGSLAGSPIGGAALAAGSVGTGTFTDLTGEGVDRQTALGAAGIDALATGIGVLMPASLGSSLAIKAASGALLNVPVGMAQRYGMGEYMRGAGYGEIAARYDAFDAQAIMTDAVIGAGFGAGPAAVKMAFSRGRPSQALVDAAMVQRQARHAEVDLAPGMAADVRTANAHVRALDTAGEQLLRGQPVAVDAIVRDTRFVPKPEAPMPEVAALVQALDDLGFGQLVGDIRELEAELQGRGREIAEPALPDVPVAPRRAMAETAPAPRAEIVPIDGGVAEIRSPDGALLGNMITEDTPKALTIRGIELEPDARGQDVGGDLYRRLADQAIEQGKVLASDSEVTVEAARSYDALERQGYTVKRNPVAKLSENGKWRTPDDSPVFEVTKGPEAQPTVGAEQPTSGERGAAAPERAAERVVAEIAAEKPEMALPASVVRAVMPDARALTPESELGRDILRLRDEIGWFERGGRMIRDGQVINDVNAGADFGRSSGDVVGRTKWTPKARLDGQGDSTLWRDRPVKLTETEAYAALDKFASGQKLTKRERGFIAYMGEMSARYDAERAADAADREIDAIAADIDRRLAMREESFAVADAMAAADEAVDRATMDSAAYEAAVNCFMRNG